MSTRQQSNPTPAVRAGRTQRWAAALVPAAVAGIFALLWAGGRGVIDLGSWFGVCGFRQKTGWPCPGCFWTTAGQAFCTGHVLQAFAIQPAAATVCLALAAIAVLALLTAVFGIKFNFLYPPRRTRVVKYAAVAVTVLVLLGWLASLVRVAGARVQ